MNMGTGVFVLNEASALTPKQVACFGSADAFQDLLARFSALHAGDQMNSANPRRFLSIDREQSIASEPGGAGRWLLDHLFLVDALWAMVTANPRAGRIRLLFVTDQGDGGFLQAPVEFMRSLREITRRHGIVLIVDEIQTGFGRTGKMFGLELSGIQPDLVTVAESLGGGLPISGVVGRVEIMDAPTPGGFGGAYGGNALACAAALAVLDAFEQDALIERAAELGLRLSSALDAFKTKHADIGVVRGLGFMRAIEFVTDGVSKKPDADRAQKVIERARERGLLVIKCGVYRNIVRFLAPIVLSNEDLDEPGARQEGRSVRHGSRGTEPVRRRPT